MSKKSNDGRDESEPVRARPQHSPAVITPARGGLSVNWSEVHGDPPVENFAYFIALKRWTANDAAYLLLGIDPLKARPWEGPRNPSLRDAYQRILLLLEHEEYAVLPFEPQGGTVTYASADVIRWALGNRDALPVPLPPYWPAAVQPTEKPAPTEPTRNSSPESRTLPQHKRTVHAIQETEGETRGRTDGLRLELTEIMKRLGLSASTDQVIEALKQRVGKSATIVAVEPTGVVWRQLTTNQPDKTTIRALRKRIGSLRVNLFGR